MKTKKKTGTKRTKTRSKRAVSTKQAIPAGHKAPGMATSRPSVAAKSEPPRPPGQPGSDAPTL